MGAKIVALLGVSGSGKSVVTRCLMSHGFQRVRFGDPARDMLSAGFGCTPHEIDGDQRDVPQRRFGGRCVQSVMNSLSHEWGRASIHSDIWVHEWQRRVSVLDGFVLTDDLQRPNEAAAVRELGGVIVRITRPGFRPTDERALYRQAEIASDIELVNERPDKLQAATERFLTGLVAQLSDAAA